MSGKSRDTALTSLHTLAAPNPRRWCVWYRDVLACRSARGIGNRFTHEVGATVADAVLPFPWQNAMTRPLRSAAANAQRAELLALWAARGMRMVRRQSTADLLRRLIDEYDSTLVRLTHSLR